MDLILVVPDGTSGEDKRRLREAVECVEAIHGFRKNSDHPQGPLEAFARHTAIGDMVITVLAWLSLIALRAGWRLAIPAVWLFNLVGLGDLLLNLGHGVRLQVASQLGAAWFGPAFIVPGMLVIHVLVFVFLVRSKAGAV